MANFVKVRVPNITLISAAYDRIAIHRATAYNGVYAEITTAGNRITLDPAEISYIYIDTTGTTTSYYRYGFVHSVTGATSALSEQFQGENDIALPILTPEELRRDFLHGIPLEDGNGVPLSDHFSS